MALAQIDGAELWYDVHGSTGPWVALIQGGRHMATELESMARLISQQGYRVLVHDRRNCGRSSIDFTRRVPEEETWVGDLRALLDVVVASSAFVVGRSRGARIALRFALAHPDVTRGLFLWGLSAGRLSLRFLDDYYFTKYLRACRTGGMEAVSALDHFALLIEARPENRDVLLSIDPAVFIEIMEHWRDAFLDGADLPVMGIPDEYLSQIAVPTAIMPYYDPLHPIWAVEYAHRMIVGSTLFDFPPGERDASRDDATAAEIFCGFAAGKN